jgi:hypothetical protein
MLFTGRLEQPEASRVPPLFQDYLAGPVLLLLTSNQVHIVYAEVEGIMGGLLWTIIVVLFVMWLAGFALHFGGGLIHLLLVIALVLIVFNLLTGRGARV